MPATTYAIAHAAATDAGNRSMRAAGRSNWSVEDYKACVSEFDRLLPNKRPPAAPPAATLTLADHAEAWTREQGEPVPPRGTDAWKAMYEKWVAWAFADLS